MGSPAQEPWAVWVVVGPPPATRFGPLDSNRTSDYIETEQCTGWILGNVLVEADFELSAP